MEFDPEEQAMLDIAKQAAKEKHNKVMLVQFNLHAHKSFAKLIIWPKESKKVLEAKILFTTFVNN